ncbi:MAG: CotH kinase family protein [Bacteroidales bacterium]|nr:CotH kinase family protein [Bacteroidales bacterium]
MKHTLLFAIGLASSLSGVVAQTLTFSQKHGFYDAPFSVEIKSSANNPNATIRFTLDGSEPSPTSTAYTSPIEVAGNTLLRAAFVADTGRVTPVVTATYLFTDDVLAQSNTPEGYPTTWGKYSQMSGTATADYEMDPEMTNDATLRPKIADGLMSLPVLSIVTDRDNLFSHENDSVRGGIYIFTGPPVEDNTGHGWTRPASIELFGGPQKHDMSATCGLRLHGGHGRLAEKNPKHSFRLVFKEKYGTKSLKYKLFDDEKLGKYDQLVLRCHFGNAWQHWGESNRQQAQYTRDVWARRMQRKIGRTSVNALYVHLFLNGMYWGLYNIAERVDDQYGMAHLGGSKADIDVIKIEEDGGNHIEASEGDLSAWQMLVATAQDVARSGSDNTAYYRLQGLNADGERDPELEPLLDIDGFIDYMIINQYGGNNDWDHHNWYALRRRGADSQGFRFLCWDSELILEDARRSVLGTNNGSSFPTGIFNNLLCNTQFTRRYVNRAKELLADDGLLGEESAVQVFDSLYNVIHEALYCEAARWGDYRRDVHPWQSRGSLYTVDDTYMKERNRLLTQFFPVRSANALNDIVAYAGIDDFEAPANWVKLTAAMFQEWDGTGINAQPTRPYNVDWNFGVSLGGGSVVVGSAGVEEYRYANLDGYDYIVFRGKGNGVRLLANRLVKSGPYKQIIASFNANDRYWNSEWQAIVIPLADLRELATNEGRTRVDAFVHLNTVKVDWSSSLTVTSAYLIPADGAQSIRTMADRESRVARPVYDLFGREVSANGSLRRGVYVAGGRKVMVK